MQELPGGSMPHSLTHSQIAMFRNRCCSMCHGSKFVVRTTILSDLNGFFIRVVYRERISWIDDRNDEFSDAMCHGSKFVVRTTILSDLALGVHDDDDDDDDDDSSSFKI